MITDESNLSRTQPKGIVMRVGSVSASFVHMNSVIHPRQADTVGIEINNFDFSNTQVEITEQNAGIHIRFISSVRGAFNISSSSSINIAGYSISELHQLQLVSPVISISAGGETSTISFFDELECLLAFDTP